MASRKGDARVAVRGGASMSSTPAASSTPTEAPSIGWDTHKAVEDVPQSLVRELEGNDSMRSKFEALCRKAQNDICKQIEELDGEGKARKNKHAEYRGYL
ncbi:unnamed protein product [Hapterophycus canaliculatus]